MGESVMERNGKVFLISNHFTFRLAGGKRPFQCIYGISSEIPIYELE